MIFETENQKILLIKDFLQTDKTTKILSIKKEFEYLLEGSFNSININLFVTNPR